MSNKALIKIQKQLENNKTKLENQIKQIKALEDQKKEIEQKIKEALAQKEKLENKIEILNTQRAKLSAQEQGIDLFEILEYLSRNPEKFQDVSKMINL